MKKQTIIVTGASSGIGKAIARHFLEKGDNVVINSFTFDKLERVYREFGAGENLDMVAGDVSNKVTGENLLTTAMERFGSVDVLVNNAGIYDRKPFLQVDEAFLDRLLNTNLKGTYFTTQAIIPQMQKQRSGVVINIGTPLVNHVLAGVPISAAMASKGAIHALTIQLAGEFASDNIRVNTVAPGTIRTTAHGYDAGQVADIAEMVYTIARSTFINGAIIHVDGGMAVGRNVN